MPKNLFVAICVSAFLAMMLSLVPNARWNQADIPTFQPSHPIHMSEQNALDLFTMMTTHYNIKRIKWENSSVYVDLAVEPAQKVELSYVYQDFYNLTRGLYIHTDNVKQVFFRVLEEKGMADGAKLLIAIQTDRSKVDMQKTTLEQLPEVSDYVKSTFPVRIDPYFYERISP